MHGTILMSNRLPHNVRILGWASFLNDVASEAVYAILPSFLLSIGIGRTGLGLLEGLANSTSSLLKLFVGAWSDRLGHRKSFIVAGYALSSLSRPILGLVTSAIWVFGLRLSDRVGKGLRTAPRDALITESTPDSLRGRAFGFHRSMDHLGAAIGPLLATAFLLSFPGQLGWMILLTIFPGVLVVLLIVFGLRNTATIVDDAGEMPPVKSKRKPLFGALPQGGFRYYLLALVVFTFANSSDVFLLVRAEELGVSTTWLPVLWSMLAILNSFGNRWGGWASDRWSLRGMIVCGWLLYAVVYLGFGWATSAWQVWLLFAVYAGFFALTEAPEKKMVARFAATGEAGAAFGWFHTTLGLANLPSSLLFGWLYQNFGAAIAFGWCAAAAVIAAALLVLMGGASTNEADSKTGKSTPG
jgi:MFS family permease